MENNKEIWNMMQRAAVLERTIVRMIYARANKEAIVERVNGLADLNRSLCFKLMETKTNSEKTTESDVYTDINDLDLPEFMVRG